MNDFKNFLIETLKHESTMSHEVNFNRAERHWDLINHFMSTGLKVKDYISEHTPNDYDYVALMRNYNSYDRVTHAIGFQLLHRFVDKQSMDEVVYNIATSPKRGFESTLLDRLDKFDVQSNLCRNAAGELYPQAYFKALQSKANAAVLMKSIVLHDDAEALMMLRSISYYNKAMEGRGLARLMNGISINANCKVYSELMGSQSGEQNDPGKMLGDYLNLIIGYGKNVTMEDAMSTYQPEMSTPYGSSFLAYCMEKWSINSSEAQLALVRRFVEDGADWYLAFRQTVVSPSIYLDLMDREKQPLAEIKEMVLTWKECAPLARHTRVLHEIVAGLPTALVDEAMQDNELSKSLGRILKKVASVDAGPLEVNTPT